MTTFKNGDMWDRFGKVDLFCITTNGTLNSKGNLIMGAGIAKEASRRMPELPKEAGECIKAYYELSRGNDLPVV